MFVFKYIRLQKYCVTKIIVLYNCLSHIQLRVLKIFHVFNFCSLIHSNYTKPFNNENFPIYDILGMY